MKKGVLKVGLAALLVTGVLFAGDIIAPTEGFVFAAEAQKTQAEISKIKGKITNISQKAKTIAVANKKTSFFLVKFSDDTELKGVESTKEFKVGEAIVVQYKAAGGENHAVSLEKALVKLPKGVTEVKTEELAKLIKDNKDVVVIDARPPAKYAESHIKHAVSLPYAKLSKMGDDGAKALEKYKGKQLVFYCGGNT